MRLMKLVLGFSDDELKKTYGEWNNDEMNGYLLEITGDIFGMTDKKTGGRLIDQILDVARQKGTGMWTSQSAMELQVPLPTIDIAVAMRDLSVFEKEREMASRIFRYYGHQFQWRQKSVSYSITQSILCVNAHNICPGICSSCSSIRKVRISS